MVIFGIYDGSIAYAMLVLCANFYIWDDFILDDDYDILYVYGWHEYISYLIYF